MGVRKGVRGCVCVALCVMSVGVFDLCWYDRRCGGGREFGLVDRYLEGIYCLKV